MARAGGRYALKTWPAKVFHSKHDFNGSESAAGFGFEPDLLCSRPRIVYRVRNEAKGTRIERAGYSNVSGLSKDKDGIWKGTASKGATPVVVALDYQGNVVSK